MSRPFEIQTPLGVGALKLMRMSGSEHISQLSEFRVSLKSKRPDIMGEKMLGQNVTMRLEMALNNRTPRFFNGYLTRWSGVIEVVDSVKGEKDTKAYLYGATVSPWLWFLTRQSNSRIFQDKTTPEILKEVFAAHGSLASFEDKLTRTYPRQSYCCQYRETDFNFVSRLMEQDGIYYYTTHENGSHKLVLADSSAHHTEYPGYEELRFDEEDRPNAEIVQRWSAQYDIQPGKYTVDDYNPETPLTKLSSFAEKKRDHPYSNMQFYDYPAEFDKPPDGRFYATTRLEELQAQYHTFEGGGKVRGFQPGRVFKLDRFPVQAYNAKYLIVGATYTAECPDDVSGGGSSFEFSTQIRAMPANEQYRAPRATPKPLIQGPQTATVVGGASATEIYTDDPQHMGCVKVLFRWDRSGKDDSSCWIRVAQSWAGNGYGSMAIPRAGQEVVVEFLEGDPDWPIITGSVYNGVNKPPYKLPDEKTRWGLKSRSSEGGGASNFNELRFEDKLGSEEIYLHAEMNHNVYIKNDRTERILNESNLDVAKDVLGKFGADVHADITGDQITQIGGGLHLKVTEDWQGKFNGRMAVDAGQEIHLKAGIAAVIEAATSITLKVGGNFINIGAAGIFIKGTMVMVNSGGAAGSGSGSSPKTPKTAKQAVDSTGGTDKPVSPKVEALIAARASATPFCEICNA